MIETRDLLMLRALIDVDVWGASTGLAVARESEELQCHARERDGATTRDMCMRSIHFDTHLYQYQR